MSVRRSADAGAAAASASKSGLGGSLLSTFGLRHGLTPPSAQATSMHAHTRSGYLPPDQFNATPRIALTWPQSEARSWDTAASPPDLNSPASSRSSRVLIAIS